MSPPVTRRPQAGRPHRGIWKPPSWFAREVWVAIGRQIQEARADARLSLASLALTARISKQALHMMEHGTRGPKIETLYRIANATNKPVSYFLPSGLVED